MNLGSSYETMVNAVINGTEYETGVWYRHHQTGVHYRHDPQLYDQPPDADNWWQRNGDYVEGASVCWNPGTPRTFTIEVVASTDDLPVRHPRSAKNPNLAKRWGQKWRGPQRPWRCEVCSGQSREEAIERKQATDRGGWPPQDGCEGGTWCRMLTWLDAGTIDFALIVNRFNADGSFLFDEIFALVEAAAPRRAATGTASQLLALEQVSRRKEPERFVADPIRPHVAAAASSSAADSEFDYLYEEQPDVSHLLGLEHISRPRRRGKGRARKMKCFTCGELGHAACDCPHAERGRKCFCCGQFGHIAACCTEFSRHIADVAL